MREGSTAICAEAAAGGGGEASGAAPSAGQGGDDSSSGSTGQSGQAGADALGGSAGTVDPAGDGGWAGDGAGDRSGAGGVGDAGAGGATPSCAGDELQVSLRLPEQRDFLCSDELSPMVLTVEGGLPPYTWSLRDSPEFTLLTPSDVEAEVVLEDGATAGEYQLRAGVSDDCGNETSREFPIEVRARPQIVAAPLPRACATRLYQARLVLTSPMEGVEWEASALPSELHMNASTGVITGIPTTDRAFEVTASNACGSSPAAQRTVRVLDAISECPVRPSSSNRFAVLPVPCEGAPYSAALDFPGVVNSQVLEHPPGLELGARGNGLRVPLSGTPTDPGNLIVSVSDAAGIETVAGFAFEPRQACWFAYVSDDEESALHIFDPLLFDEASGERSARPGVSSFEFSPDGRFLAYVTQGEVWRELSVVDLTTWEERVVRLDGHVFHYAWSASAYLAVAFGDDEPTQLGGASVGEFEWESGSELVPLQPVAANVTSDLTWIGDEFVAYVATNPNVDGRLLTLARRDTAEDAFSAPFVAGPVYEAPNLQPTGDGVFVTDWRSTSGGSEPEARVRLDYVVPTQDPFVRHLLHSHATDEVVAPSGHYTGRSDDGVFAAFLPSADTFDGPGMPALERTPCDKFLAWSRDGQRIACVNESNVVGQGELRLFELGTGGVGGQVVPGAANHDVASYNLARRAFSPNGAWFGYLMEDGLFLAETGNPSRPAERISAGSNAVDLEFSPDGSVVLVQPPANADLFVLSTNNVESETSSGPASVRACVEEYVRAPHQWCGSGTSSAGFKWAPFGTTVAYETVAGDLVVADLSHTNQGTFETVLNTQAKRFAFQPAPDSQRPLGD